jgi:predicted lipoprotein with Yx(FWY)xxD motif
VIGAITLAFVAAGCGGAIPSSNGGPATLKLSSSTHGQFLVDSQGHTLYLFEKDDGGESYCNGACASVWPPLETSSSPHAMSGLDASALGTITRDNGDKQVTYHGHPLYYYAADASSPGKTKGEDVDQFGSSWYLVNAGGKPIEPESSGSESSGSNSGSNYGSNKGSNSGSNTGSNTGSNNNGGAWG